MTRFAPWLLVVTCATLGCEPDEGLADGERCAAPKECRSGSCSTDGTCGGSGCDCPNHDCGERGVGSGDCDDGWLCVRYTSLSDDIGSVFGQHPDKEGLCILPCSAGCPEHFSCTGEVCSEDHGWASPNATIEFSGAVDGRVTDDDENVIVRATRGASLLLEGRATSPAGASSLELTWSETRDSASPVESSGDSLRLQLDADYERITLTARDERQRSAIVYVTFQTCADSGESCGEAGDGCCVRCDSETNTCTF